MSGKRKCEAMQRIRMRIAEENGIEHTETPCTHSGSCSGSCPKCDQDLKRLEEKISAGKRALKTVSILGMAALLAGCSVQTADPSAGKPELPRSDTEEALLMGEIPAEDLFQE